MVRAAPFGPDGIAPQQLIARGGLAPRSRTGLACGSRVAGPRRSSGARNSLAGVRLRSPDQARNSGALPLHIISSYDIGVAVEDGVTDEQIQQWADEAEAGYVVEQLKRRGRGRPGRGAEPMQVIAVRLTAEEIAALDAYAERENVSRSEAIRRALAAHAA